MATEKGKTTSSLLFVVAGSGIRDGDPDKNIPVPDRQQCLKCWFRIRIETSADQQHCLDYRYDTADQYRWYFFLLVLTVSPVLPFFSCVELSPEALSDTGEVEASPHQFLDQLSPGPEISSAAPHQTNSFEMDAPWWTRGAVTVSSSAAQHQNTWRARGPVTAAAPHQRWVGGRQQDGRPMANVSRELCQSVSRYGFFCILYCTVGAFNFQNLMFHVLGICIQNLGGGGEEQGD